MTLSLSHQRTISPEAFIDLLERSGLAARRPVDNRECILGMLDHADLLVVAFWNAKLVGVARSVTDFHYCCYVSDLAVDKEFQKQGLGKALLHYTQQQLKNSCKLILLAAPDAHSYYQHLGFEAHPRCWTLAQTLDLKP